MRIPSPLRAVFDDAGICPNPAGLQAIQSISLTSAFLDNIGLVAVNAPLAELVDAPHSKCGSERSSGSSPEGGTITPFTFTLLDIGLCPRVALLRVQPACDGFRRLVQL
jgi:hypothetical protein